MELGLSGSVRNRADGSVEVHAEGSLDALERFGRRLARGPAGARVDAVEEVQSSLPVAPGEFQVMF